MAEERRQVQAKEILDRIRDDYQLIRYKSCQVIGDIDFTTLNYEEIDSDKKFTVNSEINVCDCWLTGKIFIASNMTNSVVKFTCIVSFWESYFLKDLNCDNVVFEKEVSFTRVIFKAKVSFKNATFIKHVDWNHANFMTNADFSDGIFSTTTDFSDANFNDAKFIKAIFKDASFIRSEFSKRATFANAKFKNVQFDVSKFFMHVTFKDVEFGEWASFYMAKFTEGANFDGATFTKRASFIDATFTKRAYFINATFTQGANFNGVTFTEGVNFDGATFTKRANFIGAIFTKRANFIGATFTEGANFDGATFTEGANFDGATFTSETNFEFIKGSGIIILKEIKVNESTDISLSNTTSYEGKIYFVNCDMKYIHFILGSFDSFVFKNAIWHKNKKKNRIKLIDEELPSKHDKMNSIDRIHQTELVYRWLKSRYQGLKDYETADLFYCSEIHMKRKKNKEIQRQRTQLKKDKPENYKKKRNELKNRKHKAMTWTYLYKLTSDYGTNWGKPLLIVLGIIALFSGLSIADHFVVPGGKLVYMTAEVKAGTKVEYVNNNVDFIKGNSVVSTILYALYYHGCNSFFIPQKHVEATGALTIVLCRLENALVTALLIISGLAIRRMFKQ